MAIHKLQGTGAPTSTPTGVGDHYTDTQNNKTYISIGTSSSADWQEVGAGSGGTAGPWPQAYVMTYSETVSGGGYDRHFTISESILHNKVILPASTTTISDFDINVVDNFWTFTFPNLDNSTLEDFRLVVPNIGLLNPSSTTANWALNFDFGDRVHGIMNLWYPDYGTDRHLEIPLPASGTVSSVTAPYGGYLGSIGASAASLVFDIKLGPVMSAHDSNFYRSILIDMMVFGSAPAIPGGIGG